jgi:oligopeptide transport system ATP-binding protein
MSLLEANGVVVRFTAKDVAGRKVSWEAVSDVAVSLGPGERLGIVGESGSGKTTLAKALLALEPLAVGQVLFDGESVGGMSGDALKAFRRRAQMIFQDPMGSLNPRMTVGASIAEVLAVHRLIPKGEIHRRVDELMVAVGLDSAYTRRYPHEFSGGQRQRVGIARALALNPVLLVADEPVSALDVSVQAQILNLLKDLSEARGMACLLIAHDLAVVRYVCERVMVMYKGRVVEEGLAADVFAAPKHPYTQLLRESVPDPDRIPERGAAGIERESDAVCVSSAGGCGFADRCPLARERCCQERPLLVDVEAGWRVACHAPGGNWRD